MKNLILLAFVAFMLPTGIVMLTDVTLVLCGDIRPQSGGGIIPDWYNSPIFGYNVSRAANVVIGMMGIMALFVGCMMIYIMRENHKSKGFRPNVDFNSSNTRKLLKSLASQDRPE